jgi:hypothetical protein
MELKKKVPQIRRLDFVLPDFLRVSWASPHARQVWADRLWRTAKAWREIEWLSVTDQVRDCALITVSPQSMDAVLPQWESAGLAVLPLEGANGSRKVVLGRRESAEKLRRACVADDHQTIGLLLGYPECCRKAFVEHYLAEGVLDPAWAIPFASELACNPVMNVLWRSAGLRAIPHIPCSTGCAPSSALGLEFLRVGAKAGFQQEIAWLEEILSWPAEWSALHGIAELKAPILKLCTRTDSTAEKLVIRWAGTRYPEEGATGVLFPYHMPEKKFLTDSPGFQRGLDTTSHLVQIDANKA